MPILGTLSFPQPIGATVHWSCNPCIGPAIHGIFNVSKEVCTEGPINSIGITDCIGPYIGQ